MILIAALTLAGLFLRPLAELSGSEPQLAANGNSVYIAYGSGDRMYVSRSDDAARSFNGPVELPTSGRLSLGMRRGPRIAASGRSVVVLAVYGRQGGGKDGDVLAWRSNDSGRSWQGPSFVSDVSGSASEGLHALAVSPNGRFGAAWLDHRARSAEIWSSTSDDDGRTWSKNVRVYRSPDGHVCECCHPSVAFGPKGEFYVMFRNWVGGSRDMYVAKSESGGDAFGPAVKLGEGTWPLNACPMDGGSFAVGPDGTIYTVWRRNETVFTTSSGNSEVEVGPGTQPWLAVHEKEERLVWLQQGRVVSEGFRSPLKMLGRGSDPVIAYASGHFLAAWTDEDGRIQLRNAD